MRLSISNKGKVQKNGSLKTVVFIAISPVGVMRKSLLYPLIIAVNRSALIAVN